MDGQINVRNSASTQFFGLLLNWALYGILLAQTYTFHVAFPNDKTIHKTVVYAVLLLEHMQTAILTYGVYDSFVANFGDTLALERVHLAWLAVPLFSGLVGFIAHIFYVYRLYMLSQSATVSTIIIAISLLQLGSSIAETIHDHYSVYYPTLRRGSVTALAIRSFSTAACDILIAVYMTHYLLKCDARLKHKTAWITRLIRLSFETGIITATAATLIAILFMALPENEAFNVPSFILTKLYSNALLLILNSRISVEYRPSDSVWSRMMQIDTNPISYPSTIERIHTGAPANAESSRSIYNMGHWGLRLAHAEVIRPVSPSRIHNVRVQRDTFVFSDAGSAKTLQGSSEDSH